MKFTISIITIIILIMPLAAIAYSQDPRSCQDPKTQYPSNPPCIK